MVIKWKKPWLLLPASWSQILGHFLLTLRSIFFKKKSYLWSSFYWKNLYFENPLGSAAGLDKSGDHIQGWLSYGAGFLEVGTITPKKQGPNPGKIVDKDLKHEALWNHMGFPNKGPNHLIKNLKKIPKPHAAPIFISLGKNRSTPLEESVKDYNFLIKNLSPYADAFVINISSPNTPSLRDLFKPSLFENFLDSLMTTLRKIKNPPLLLLKISPDLSDDDFLKVISTSFKKGVDGWVICNSTKKRYQTSFPLSGGLSGRPLSSRSKHCLKLLVQFLGSQHDKLIVSVGGVMTSQDVFERLKMGAHLVQTYTALTLYGPSFFKQVHRDFNQNQRARGTSLT